MYKKRVFFYINADKNIGSGHFWRCFSIANELQERDILPAFIYTSVAEDFLTILGEHHYEAFPLTEKTAHSFAEIIFSGHSKDGPSLLVIDSDDQVFYTEKFQTGIIGYGMLLMIITVNPGFKYYAHILLNQNIIALYQDYSTEEYTRRLFGPEYFIYSPRFQAIGNLPIRPIGNNIFVSFGFSDPCHYTLRLLTAIVQDRYFDAFKFYVVVGGLNEDYEKIQSVCKGQKGVKLYYNVTDVAKVMDQCDLAVCSAGLTFWELTLMGIRAILFPGSAREKAITAFLQEHAFAIGFHSYDDEFNAAKMESFKDLLATVNDSFFSGFPHLKMMLNPRGIDKICSEIDALLTQ